MAKQRKEVAMKNKSFPASFRAREQDSIKAEMVSYTPKEERGPHTVVPLEARVGIFCPIL